MKLRRLSILFLALTLLLTAACNQNGDTEPDTSPAPETSPTDDGSEPNYNIQLTGAEEAPQAGDPDGSGTAEITIDVAGNQLCFKLQVQNIGPANASHIHKGAKGSAGPVFIGLTAPTEGSSEGCVDATSEQLQEILDNPAGFYVNVHNEEFPGGAVRGQLA